MILPPKLRKFSRLPTFGKLPDFDPDFNPRGFLMMRPVAYRTVSSHVLCGDPRSGKTTFINEGLHELAAHGLYDPEDLRKFPTVRKTRRISRFALERYGVFPEVDSWIDVDGESFLNSFGLDGPSQQHSRALEKIYHRVNSMVMLLPAQRLLDLHHQLEGCNAAAAEAAADYIDGIVKRHRALRPHLGRKAKRIGFKWFLIVSQCGDVVGPRHWHSQLTKAVQHFADKTGTKASHRRAILMDSVPAPLKRRKISVATVALGPRGGLRVAGGNNTLICSAGVAMGIVLNRIRCTSKTHRFIQSLTR